MKALNTLISAFQNCLVRTSFLLFCLWFFIKPICELPSLLVESLTHGVSWLALVIALTWVACIMCEVCACGAIFVLSDE